MKMKKFVSLVLVVLMIAMLFAGCGSKTSDSGVKTIEKGKLIMSTNAAFPPYEMTDDSGKYIGIDIEIAEAIAAKLGLELVVDDMSFTGALEAAQRGKADMTLGAISVTEARLAVMDFSNTYATGVQVVIVPEDSDIKTIDDIDGKKVGTQMGTTGYLYCSDTPENGGYGEDNVIGYDKGMTAVKALLNGQIDCVIIDQAPAQEYVAANPGLKILETEWVTEEYAIGFGKNNTQLVNAVNDILAELTADGTIQQIMDKYLAAN